MAWAIAYNRTLNQGDPRESGFETPADADAFETEGRRLWSALRRDLGDTFRVDCFSDREGKLLS